MIIPFYLKRASRVKLETFNLKGEVIAVLVNQELPAGQHQTRLNVASYPAGVYFYRLAAGNQTVTRKMVSLRGL
jgi:hypothetical protein